MAIVMFQIQNGAAQSGNALVEYALIGALVAVVAIPALSMLGLSVNNTVSNILKAGSQHPTNQQANMPQATKPATQKPNNTSAITNGAALNTMLGKQVAGNSPEITQTVGANGNNGKVSGKSAVPTKLTKKFQQEEPQVIVELGEPVYQEAEP